NSLRGLTPRDHGRGGPGQNPYYSETISPPEIDPSACQVLRLIFSETKWTDPSALRTFTPPGCLLREAAVISFTLPPPQGKLRRGLLYEGGQNRADGLNTSGIALFGAAWV